MSGPPVVILGSGNAELVAALYLARSGRKVLVLEPGEPDPEAAGHWMPPRLARSLQLDRYGWTSRRPDPWIAAPLDGGGRLELWRDWRRAAEAIRRLSRRDADRWPGFVAMLHRSAQAIEALFSSPPPDLFTRRPGELLGLVRWAMRLRGLGRAELADLLRLVPISVWELLDDWFETPALKGLLAALALRHLSLGPRASGTAWSLLGQQVGNPPGVFRLPQSNLPQVLRQAARARGVELRRAQAAGLVVRAGRVAAVRLASGEELAAGAVVSGLDPRQTLLAFVGPEWLDPELVAGLQHCRRRGAAARVHLALAPGAALGPLVVAPSIEYLERAADCAKYGRIADQPYLEVRPEEPRAAAEQRLTVHLQFAPYRLASGSWDQARASALGALAVRTLAQAIPELPQRVQEIEVLSPRDLEARYGHPEGHPYHLELTLDQVLFMRPLPALARYATPIGGLYLCGPGTHPGGQWAAASGVLAARALMRLQRS